MTSFDLLWKGRNMAIELGDAIWRITGDSTSLNQAMNTARQNVGIAMTAAGAAITGFAATSVVSFANTADEIAKMAQRTGFSTEALSELAFVADQSGTSITGLEKASRNLSGVIVDAANGNETYQATLANLGISWEQLAGLSPEEQFLKVGLALADVENATLRTSLASDLFGARMGTQLLPMLNQGSAGIEALREEARRLGLSLGPETTAQAEVFNDTMNAMNKALGSLSREVAEILIPMLTDLMVWVRDTAIAFRDWRQENPELVGALTKLTVAAGAVMTVLGPLLIMLPGIAAAFTAVKATVIAVMTIFGALGGAVSAPVAIAIAAVGALAAAGVYLWQNWETVKGKLIGVWEVLKNAFELLFAPILAAWGMIKNAVGYTDTSGLNQGALDRYNGVPAFASGGIMNRGGMALVGEQGPELVQLPTGAQVFDSRQSAGMMGGGVTINFGRDSVRSDADIREITQNITRVLESNMRGAGLGFT